MIKYIRMTDFQSHKDTCLTLSPNFNIIVGPNGSGKSAVLRAVESLCFNTPGVAEVRWPDATQYCIEVALDDVSVKRCKGESVNTYQIAGGSLLADVNKDVPESVTKALRIQRVSLDTDCEIAIQFSDQLDSPFMLSEKDSVKMKFLNVLSGTNAVDLAAKEAVQLTKENVRKAKQSKERIADLILQEESLKTKLENVRKLNSYVAKKTEQLDELYAMREPLQRVKSTSEYLVSEYKKISLFTDICKRVDFEAILGKINRISDLQTLLEKYKHVKHNSLLIKQMQDKLAMVNEVAILHSTEQYLTHKELHNKYDRLKTSYNEALSSKSNVDKSYAQAKELYANALRQAKTCPICANAITDSCIDKLLKSL